jgi:hypothetical protein
MGSLTRHVRLLVAQGLDGTVEGKASESQITAVTI